jgi:HD superfamily phosphohydrolase YqeK
MSNEFDHILELALPYLDVRQNEVHVRMAYDFAKRLLKSYSEAEEDIVLPAILLHDVGWKAIPEDELMESFGPRMKSRANQRRHETEGVKIADLILSKIGYPRASIDRILRIIDGHDTRLEAQSLNDKLVKDADKLWRFTPTGVGIDHKRFGVKVTDLLRHLDEVVDQWMFTPEAKTMARAALVETRKEFLPDQADE